MKFSLNKYAQIMLTYTLFLVLWGAWVRISHSGDGCGDSWPLCGDDYVPLKAAGKTWIEYTHRVTSGLFGLFVLHFNWLLYRSSSSRPAKSWGLVALVLTITEGLFGAVLVKKGLVANNDSTLRGFFMGLHFLNSAALVMAFSSTELNLRKKIIEQSDSLAWPSHWNFNLRRISPAVVWIGLALLGITGTWAALSTTLFPSSNLTESWQKEFQDQAHWVLKARSFHPVLALFFASFFAVVSGALASALKAGQAQSEMKKFSALMGITILIGLLTLFTLSPVVLKLAHLLLAHLIVIQLTRLQFSMKS